MNVEGNGQQISGTVDKKGSKHKSLQEQTRTCGETSQLADAVEGYQPITEVQNQEGFKHLPDISDSVVDDLFFDGAGNSSIVGGEDITHNQSQIETVSSTNKTTTSIHPMVTRLKSKQQPTITNQQVSLLSTTQGNEPKNFKTALKQPIWKKAMEEELQALYDNHTWDLVRKPTNTNIVGCKWIFKTKFKEDGSIDRHKARLVVQGYSQVVGLGLDYNETFNPLVKPTI